MGVLGSPAGVLGSGGPQLNVMIQPTGGQTWEVRVGLQAVDLGTEDETKREVTD